jgi:hypothetical protein
MKKVVLMMAMLLATNLSVSAEDLKSNETNMVEAYDINININGLAKYLELSKDQIESVENVQRVFSESLKIASAYDSKEARKNMVKNAIEYDLRNLNYILTNSQYKKYVTVLNATLNNRGIEK